MGRHHAGALRDGFSPAFEGPVLLLVGEVFRELGAMEHEAEVRLAITERCLRRVPPESVVPAQAGTLVIPDRTPELS